MKTVLNPCAVCCNRTSCARKMEADKLKRISGSLPLIDDSLNVAPKCVGRIPVATESSLAKRINTSLG